MAKDFLKKIVRRIWRSDLYAEVLRFTDRAGALLVGPQASNEGFTVVLSPAGDGNIGDSAMLLAFLDKTNGPVKVMMKVPKGHAPSPIMREIRELHGSRVSFISGRPFYRSLPPARITSSIRFAREIDGASKFFIHGADTIDGGNVSASLAAWSLCKVAADAGTTCGVLGFSWRENVPQVVADSMRLVNETTPLYLRDEISWHRIQRSGASNAIQVADMAFTLQTEKNPSSAITRWFEDQKFKGTPVVALNISGLIANKMDQTDEIQSIVARIRELGASIVFVPHVIRETDNDLDICRSMFGKFGSADDLLVEELLSPLQVRWIASRADVVITGRMHFSILSLGVATPVIALATAGKVEGLFRLFGLEQLVVPVRQGFGGEVAQVLAGLWDERSTVSSMIDEKLPVVVDRSMKNFELL